MHRLDVLMIATDRERRPSAAQLNQALNSGPYLRTAPRPTRTELPPLPAQPPIQQPPARTGTAVPEPESVPPNAPATTPQVGWILVLVIAVILLFVIAANH